MLSKFSIFHHWSIFRVITYHAQSLILAHRIIFLLANRQSMSSIKIPELNLYRGKRTEKHTHYESIQKEGVNLLAKTKNKQILHELKTQLYLDTYKNNLNHFVSPSKYREKAQRYLSNSKQSDTLLLKTLSFPKPRYQCPHCFVRDAQQNRCSCQIEVRLNSLNRVRSSEGRPKEERLQPIVKKYQPQKQDVDLRPQPLKQQLRQAKEPIMDEGNYTEIVRDISNLSFHRQSQKPPSNYIQCPKRYNNNIQFIQQLNQHHNQLDNINLSLDDSSRLSVDFSGLLEAKRQYVSKSKDILQSLDKILLQSKGGD